jgi:2'-5' RNA ligase
LFNLQKTIADGLESFSEERDVIPHLTLARVKNVKNKNDLSGLMKRYENTVFGTLSVSNIKLKKSTLALKGPVYEDVAVFALSGTV